MLGRIGLAIWPQVPCYELSSALSREAGKRLMGLAVAVFIVGLLIHVFGQDLWHAAKMVGAAVLSGVATAVQGVATAIHALLRAVMVVELFLSKTHLHLGLMLVLATLYVLARVRSAVALYGMSKQESFTREDVVRADRILEAPTKLLVANVGTAFALTVGAMISCALKESQGVLPDMELTLYSAFWIAGVAVVQPLVVRLALPREIVWGVRRQRHGESVPSALYYEIWGHYSFGVDAPGRPGAKLRRY